MPALAMHTYIEGERLMLNRFTTALLLVVAIGANAGEPEVVATVQHAPKVSGIVEGSVQQLNGENVKVESSAVITGDLLVPGTPNFSINAGANYGGTVVGIGSTTPTGFTVTMNNGATLRHVVTRTNPVTLETVSVPPAPTGIRDVSVSAPGQNIGDFATLRNLALNSNAGVYSVPPGTYGTFTAHQNSAFVFGVAGSTEPTVYNLKELTIDNAELQLVGPVIINIATKMTVDGPPATVGKEADPAWLMLRVAGVSVSTKGTIYGIIKAPNGMVTIQPTGIVKGLIYSNDLTVQDGGRLYGQPAPVNTAPQVNAGANQTVTFPAAAVLNGSATDDGLPNPPGTLTYAWIKISGPGNATFAEATALSTTVTFSESGTYVLRLTASDSVLSTSSDVTIVSNQPPSVEAGATAYINFPASAAMNGSVNDDGLPTGGTLTSSWSKVSGPGTVTFANASAPVTTATFSAGGIYVLQLLASDGQATSTDDVSIVVNNPPVVSAGADQTITLPDSAILSGTVTDDGILNNVLIIEWTKLSGPGTVTFGDATKASTTASFSQGGVYVLQLSANDSLATTVDTVTIIVNTGPIANAGPDLLITFPDQALLEGVASDDGVPAGVDVTSTWSKVSGPGDVTFDDASAPVTQASFSGGGTYVLRLTVADSLATSVDDTTVIVNTRPVVNAGQYQIVNFPDDATLQGSATDDGLPDPPATLTYAWTKVSGPGTATFANAEATNTSVSFTEPGIYVLRLTASDSVADASADVTIVSNDNFTLRCRYR
jgi:cytoskeletal protein CcmA (bactofilin family)